MTSKIPAPDSVVKLLNEVASAGRISHALFEPTYGEGEQPVSLQAFLTAARKEDSKILASNQSALTGLRPHPFNMHACVKLVSANATHGACISAKVSATVGMGFKDGLVKTTDAETGKETKNMKASRADKALNPLCFGSWRSTLKAVTQDYFNCSVGYFEVVRDASDTIAAIYHRPAFTVFVNVENDGSNFHYEVVGDESSSGTTKMARFGDKDRLLASGVSFSTQASSMTSDGSAAVKKEKVSELIAIRSQHSLSRWYGFMDWMSAVPQIELSQMNTQQKFDFYNNRSVPEFMLFITGALLTKKQWDAVENSLKRTIGQGNQHKTIALNIGNPDVKVQVEKLAMESSDSSEYASTQDATSSAIVTAHGVPPILAGIFIPGKMGANNELVNAIMAFELLKIGPEQAIFEQTLGATLGGSKGVAGLNEDSFELVRLTDVMDLAAANVASKQRTPASVDKRNPNDNSGGREGGLQQH